MSADIEKKISLLIEKMFPAFYIEEGPIFIQFVKAYYEFLEEEGNTLFHSRRLLEYTDIDETLDAFLEHFQKKYLYGIPFDVIINKRTLLKHVLDVYRSKGSIQCYKLLFRLIYNQDVDIYIPGNDVLRVSDGTWKEPRYIEVSNVDGLSDLVGKTIYGLSSGASAVIESYIQEPVNQNISRRLYISNINPKGGSFNVGEKIVDYSLRNSDTIPSIIDESPTILGSVDTLDIINGGQDFEVGDLLAVVHRDANGVLSNGIGAKLKVTGVSSGNGTINFSILAPGFGITTGARTFIYNSVSDTTGSGANLTIGSIAFDTSISYNTDLLADYANLTLNAVSYSFPGNTSANSDSSFSDYLSFANATFGSLSTLGSVRTGLEYTGPVDIFIRDTLNSGKLWGNLSFDTTSSNVVGTNTTFTTLFTANSCIALQCNATANIEYHIIRNVVNNTVITLYDKPYSNSAANNSYRISPTILPSNYAIYETVMDRPDGTLNGENSIVAGVPGLGNSIVSELKAVYSGQGYVEREIVYLYLADGLAQPSIAAGGTGYANGDSIRYFGGNPIKPAVGTVQTNANGTIISTTHYGGCGYQYAPTLTVVSNTGSDASLSTEVVQFNLTSEVQGKIRKAGVGRERGFWTTTRGFISSDKYIQDSYFYQDYSYQIQAAVALEKYRGILYETFHIAGTEMFGKFSQKAEIDTPAAILYSNTSPTIS